jgi:diguanylate cyclase (GGDEF)-like protein
MYSLETRLAGPDAYIPATIFVSVPRAVVHEDINRALVQTVGGTVALTLLLIVIAMYGAERFVLRPLRAMLDMTAKVRVGDLSARTGIVRTSEELSQLGQALDEMAERLESRDADLRRALEDLREQAITDTLTGLYNRRYFHDALGREILAARRKPTVFSIVILDLDHFKRVNDTWGHDAGDFVLKSVGELVRANVRGSDVAARYGGEEFALLLTGTRVQVAEQRAENLRADIAALGLAYEGHPIRVTASLGVAEYTGAPAEAYAVIRAADAALYAAKAAGRNRVMVQDADPRAPHLMTIRVIGTHVRRDATPG